jgi:hypothetical protein
MDFFHIFPYFESTASLTVLGSSSVIDKEKFEQKLGGVYLSDSLFPKPITLILE